MTLPIALHSVCTRTSAIAAFSRSVAPEFHCDGDFVNLPDAILAFMTIGQNSNESTVSSPSRVCWSLPDIRSSSVDPYQWFPEAVRETRDASGNRTRRHHLFLRRGDPDSYIYCGAAALATYTGSPRRRAEFELDEKLTRELWVRLGGFNGWLIEANHTHHRLHADDLYGFAALLETLRDREFSHLYMTRYEEDSLHLHLNAQRAWLMYLRTPDDSGLYLPSDASCADEPVEQFQCCCGIDLEFPASGTTTHQEAFAIAAKYFQSGVMPEKLSAEL